MQKMIEATALSVNHSGVNSKRTKLNNLNLKKTLRVTSAMGPFYRKTCMVNRRKYEQSGRKVLSYGDGNS